MEGIPRIPFVCLTRRTSAKAPCLEPLKKYIKKHYKDSPRSYEREFEEFLKLRQNALDAECTEDGVAVIMRYYCQIQLLKQRFPMGENEACSITFSWNDQYMKIPMINADVMFEEACILYNIAAARTSIACKETRLDSDSMKIACTQFQYAAWCFQRIMEQSVTSLSPDMSTDLVKFLNLLLLAQAQECILEKSMLDNRKPALIAKISQQLSEYYTNCHKYVEGDDMEYICSDKTLSIWKRSCIVKKTFYLAMTQYFMGLDAEEREQHGEVVTWLSVAVKNILDLDKPVKDTKNVEFQETYRFAVDVIQGKYTSAKKDNDFVYHDPVPDLSRLPEVRGASLVKGIGFDILDPNILKKDIFQRIVPFDTLQISSLFTEKLAGLVRTAASEIEKKNVELEKTLSSLNLTMDHFRFEDRPLPQEVYDLSARLHANLNNPQKELAKYMQDLVNDSVDAESALKSLRDALDEEGAAEKEFQVVTMNRFNANNYVEELNQIRSKSEELSTTLHNAAESNALLRDHLKQALANIKHLLQPLSDIEAQLPRVSALKNENADSLISRTEYLLSKVETMRVQRQELLDAFRSSIHNENITQTLLANRKVAGGKCVYEDSVFSAGFDKFQPHIDVIHQNLAAQDNVIEALITHNAEIAPLKKQIMETRKKRDEEIMALTTDYEEYQQLIHKCDEAKIFYQHVLEKVYALQERYTSIQSVRNNERQSHLLTLSNGPDPEVPKGSNISPVIPISFPIASHPVTEKPKLKDFLMSRKTRETRSPGQTIGSSSNLISDNESTRTSHNVNPMMNPQSNNFGIGTSSFPTSSSTGNETSGQSLNINRPPNFNGSSNLSNDIPPLPPSSVVPSLTMYQQPYFKGPSLNPGPPTQNLSLPHANQPQVPMNPYQMQPTVSLGQQVPQRQPHGIPTFPAPSHVNFTPQPLQPPQFQPHVPQNGNVTPSSLNSMPSHSQTFPSHATYSQSQRPSFQTIPQPLTLPMPSQNPAFPISFQSPETEQNIQRETVHVSKESVQSMITSEAMMSGIHYPQHAQQPFPQTGQSGGFPSPRPILFSPQMPRYHMQPPNTSQMNGPHYYQGPHQPMGTAQFPLRPGTTTMSPRQSYHESVHQPSVAPSIVFPQPANTFPTVQPHVTQQGDIRPNSHPAVYSQAAHIQQVSIPSHQMKQGPSPQISHAPPLPPSNIQPMSNILPNQNSLSSFQNQPQTHSPSYPIQEVKKPAAVDLLSGSPNEHIELSFSQKIVQENIAIISPNSSTTFNQHKSVTSEISEMSNSSKGSPQTNMLQPTVLSTEELIKQRKEEQLVKQLRHNTQDPLLDNLKLNHFISEVERNLKKLYYNEERGGDGVSVGHTAYWTQEWKKAEDKIRAHLSEFKPTMAAARCSSNKNRFQEFIPYDRNRVVLGQSKDDYINASLIEVKLGDHVNPRYIACQSPLQNTMSDIWLMLLEQSCEVSVHLGKVLSPTEASDSLDKNSLLEYWPTEKGRMQAHGSLDVNLQAVKVKESWLELIITIKNRTNGQTRTLTHFVYTEVTSKLPHQEEKFAGFIRDVHTFYRQQRNPLRPMAVISSSGCGITGVFIASSAAMLYMDSEGEICNVSSQLIYDIGIQRPYLVECKEQYMAIMKTLMQHATHLLAKKGIVVGSSVPRHSSITSTQLQPSIPNSVISNCSDIVQTALVSNLVDLLAGSMGAGPVNGVNKSSGTNTPPAITSIKENSRRSSGTEVTDPEKFCSTSFKETNDMTSMATPDPFDLKSLSQNLSLEPVPKNQRKITRQDFERHRNSAVNNESQLSFDPDPSDPLSTLNPLWNFSSKTTNNN